MLSVRNNKRTKNYAICVLEYAKILKNSQRVFSSFSLEVEMQAHYSSPANEYPIPIKTSLGLSKVQFSPEISRRFLSICSWDGWVKVFDLTNLSSPVDVRTIHHKKSVLCSTFTVSLDDLHNSNI